MSVFTSEKKLGFGLMRLPLLDENDKGSIDIEHTKKMVDAFMENGFTYFDTAWMYCSGKSECAAKEALVSRYPRESVANGECYTRPILKSTRKCYLAHCLCKANFISTVPK